MDEYVLIVNALLSNDLGKFEKFLKTSNNVNITWATGIGIMHYYIGESKKLSYEPSQLIDLMIKYGLDINAKRRKEGISVLTYAVYSKNSEMVEVLLNKGAIVDIFDDHGNTPLMEAVSRYRGEPEFLDVIKTLIKFGASPDQENFYGHSPRSVVIRRHINTPLLNQPIIWDLQPILNW